jgi:hypothetical protein
MVADYDSGELKIMESEKWEWFEWGKLPKPLFIPTQNYVNQRFNRQNI